ncbi:MAG: DUF998 domain-containing protein [Asgard group archaeon]|nr:DUF998 domain-containing protein [Asgard group archaeon]
MVVFKILAICAMLSPIIYTIMWIIGGIIVPGYSHIKKDVSSLFAVEAHKRWFFQSFFIIASALLLVFFGGMHWGVNNGTGSIAGPILLIIASVIGLIVACFFPLDVGGEVKTWRGKGHFSLIVITGIITIVGMILMFVRLRLVTGWIGFAIFSLVIAIISVILVIITGIFAGSDYMGLVERFMVSTYQIYYFVFGFMVYITN